MIRAATRQQQLTQNDTSFMAAKDLMLTCAHASGQLAKELVTKCILKIQALSIRGLHIVLLKTIFILSPSSLLENPSLDEIIYNLIEDLKKLLLAKQPMPTETSALEDGIKDRLGLLLTVILKAEDKLDGFSLLKSIIKLSISSHSHKQSSTFLAYALTRAEMQITTDNLNLVLSSLNKAFDEIPADHLSTEDGQKLVDFFIELYSNFTGTNHFFITEGDSQQKEIIELGMIKFCLTKPLGKELSRRIHKKLVGSYFTPHALVKGSEAKAAWKRLQASISRSITDVTQNHTDMVAILSSQAGIYLEAFEQSIGPQIVSNSRSKITLINVCIVVTCYSRKILLPIKRGSNTFPRTRRCSK